MEEDAGGVEWFDTWALSLAVFLPLVGAVVIALLPAGRRGAGEGLLKGAALLFTLLPLLAGVGMLVLSLLLSFLCVVYSTRVLPEPRNPRAFLALLLALETGMNGTFAALDLILFFVFWELVLLPMYFLIAVWGGPRRDYASFKFILYTLIGSVI